MLLEEFDPERRAVINPDQVVKPVENMPEVAVTCFSRKTFERMLEDLDTEIITWNGTANGEEPVYRAVYKGMPIALFILDVGAPVSVGMLEEVFQMGVQKVVIFGTCGVLDSRIEDCSIIIPDRVLRDEGTSYHYAPPSDEIEVNQKSMKMFTELLDELHVNCRKNLDDGFFLPGNAGEGKAPEGRRLYLCRYGMFRQRCRLRFPR